MRSYERKVDYCYYFKIICNKLRHTIILYVVDLDFNIVVILMSIRLMKAKVNFLCFSRMIACCC
jgi:hypothetical protein